MATSAKARGWRRAIARTSPASPRSASAQSSSRPRGSISLASRSARPSSSAERSATWRYSDIASTPSSPPSRRIVSACAALAVKQCSAAAMIASRESFAGRPRRRRGRGGPLWRGRSWWCRSSSWIGPRRLLPPRPPDTVASDACRKLIGPMSIVDAHHRRDARRRVRRALLIGRVRTERELREAAQAAPRQPAWRCWTPAAVSCATR